MCDWWEVIIDLDNSLAWNTWQAIIKTYDGSVQQRIYAALVDELTLGGQESIVYDLMDDMYLQLQFNPMHISAEFNYHYVRRCRHSDPGSWVRLTAFLE